MEGGRRRRGGMRGGLGDGVRTTVSAEAFNRFYTASGSGVTASTRGSYLHATLLLGLISGCG